MCPCLPRPLITVLQTRWDFVQDSIPCSRKYSQSEYKKAVVQLNPTISNSQGKWEIVQNNEFEIAASKLSKKKSKGKGKWFWVWNTKEFKISEFELARSNCIFDGVAPDLPIMYQTKVPLYFLWPGGVCEALLWNTMEYPTCHLYFFGMHTYLKASVYNKTLHIFCISLKSVVYLGSIRPCLSCTQIREGMMTLFPGWPNF